MMNALQDPRPESRAFPHEGALDAGKRPDMLPYRPRLALLTVFVLTLFFSELAIMLVLIGDLSPAKAALIDALLIAVILLPALYFLVLRPASLNIERCLQTERASANLGRMLDLSTSECRGYIADLEHRALYDPLTDLPNRLTLQDRLQQAITAAHRATGPLAVVIVDLSRLKEVNDILGHQSGDRVLREVALRLKNALRKSDTVARLGGDEFAIVLPGAGNELILDSIRRIQEIFAQPVLLDATPVDIEAELGIALYPDHGDNPALLLQHADIAMRVAKSEQSGFSIYNPHDDPFSLKRLRRFGELRQAIHDRDLTLYYQPKIDIKTGKAMGVEALARWPHPAEGMISPIDFVPMIEQSGLIRPFTLWVLRQALGQCRLWTAAGIDLKIAVNLSTRNLLDPGFPDEIGKLLEMYRIAPSRIMLEITETAVMFRPERTAGILRRLDEMGLELSIDDFGTGYSSLARLNKLPVAEIKIDRCFVSGMIQDSDNVAIVRSTIELAHNLGLKVVAEGVESGDILNMLATFGCDIAQGYHLCHPLPPEELSRWLSESPRGSVAPPEPKLRTTAPP